MARNTERFRGPAIASFFVIGLGQIIKEQTDRGLIMMLIFYFAIPLALTISMYLSGALFIFLLSIAVILYPVYWLYNIWDAYRSPL